MAKKAIKSQALPPPSHNARIQELKLRVVSHRHETVTCSVQGEAELRTEWLPRDIISEDGKSLIIFRVADRDYSVDGYEPWHDGMHGGRETLHGALCWVETARDIRACKRSHF